MSESLSLREKIRTGPTLFGMTVQSMSPTVVEVAGLCGIDFVWIEVEHGSMDYMHLEHMCRAAELRGVIPLARIQDGNRTSVLRALEAGAKVVVVPQVHTAAQAAAVAEYGKFPPIGSRGYNTGSRGLLYGFSGATPLEIFANANRDTCLLVQIESVEAVRNVREIVAVEGIDGILAGPGDLSATMGVNSQWDSELLISTILGVFEVAHDHKKVVATVCPTMDMAKRWVDAGAHMLNTGGDLAILKLGIAEKLKQMREL